MVSKKAKRQVETNGVSCPVCGCITRQVEEKENDLVILCEECSREFTIIMDTKRGRKKEGIIID